jgi:hypothetical protein
MSRVRLALAAGLTALAVALGVVLSGAPLSVAGTNGVPAQLAVTFIRGNDVICQGAGTVPAGTVAIRVSLSVNIGPRVSLRVVSGSHVVTEGEREAGWGVDETVTVPVRRVRQTAVDARICTTVGPAVEGIQVNGVDTRSSTGGGTLLLRMEYLRPARSSWLSLVATVAHNMGIGHALSGAWVAYAAIAVMIGVTALVSRLSLRGLQ